MVMEGGLWPAYCRDGAQGEPLPAVEVVGPALPRSGCAAATRSLAPVHGCSCTCCAWRWAVGKEEERVRVY
jgi:hypothetical protein